MRSGIALLLPFRRLSSVCPEKTTRREVRNSQGEEPMKNLLAAGALMVSIAVPTASRAEDVTRFAPLKAEQLTPPQKAWADAIAVPTRNAKFGNPPYRAYIHSPELASRLSALSEYLRWNSSLPPRLSRLAILIPSEDWTAQCEGVASY